ALARPPRGRAQVARARGAGRAWGASVVPVVGVDARAAEPGVPAGSRLGQRAALESEHAATEGANGARHRPAARLRSALDEAARPTRPARLDRLVGPRVPDPAHLLAVHRV